MIERHVTIDRSRKGFDHAFALDMPSLEHFVRSVRMAEEALGSSSKTVLDTEWIARNKFHQSVVSACRIEAGETLKEEHLTIKQPSGGVPPYLLSSLLGRQLVCSVDADQLILATNINGGLNE